METSKSPRTLRGACLCERVRYEVADAFCYAAMCHCGKCRRATGSAFKPFAGIERDRLRITDGKERVKFFGDATTHDAHCADCGSLLYSQVREARFAHVTLGTLVDEPTIRPTHHIFVGSKAAWETITDSLPQFSEHAKS